MHLTLFRYAATVPGKTYSTTVETMSGERMAVYVTRLPGGWRASVMFPGPRVISGTLAASRDSAVIALECELLAI